MEITKLQSPFHLVLFEDRQVTENLYDNAIPEPIVEAINAAIRSHPLTRANEDGLIHYFSDKDEACRAFVKDHVKYAYPSVEVGDGFLRLALEIGSDCRLPEDIITAIKDNMKNQCKNDWGQEIEGIDIPLWDVVLYEPDSSIGLRNEMERKHPNYQFSSLTNPSLGLYVYDAEWTEVLKDSRNITASKDENSVLNQINRSKEISRDKNYKNLKRDKNHNRSKKNQGER